uniref:Uncharacterized protein n=1 Tax=Anguilla anguilla TaxID=7936 RepID=A0A0E9VU61_ANGAN
MKYKLICNACILSEKAAVNFHCGPLE